MPKLKLFTDRSYLVTGQRYVPLLYPFWGLPDGASNPDTDRFLDYAAVGKNLFELVPIEQADAVLLPGEWQAGGENCAAKDLAAKAKFHGKPLVIFFNADSTEEISIDNAIIFRTSFYASRRRPNEFSLPAWSPDYLKVYYSGKVPLRDKQSLPIIGYAGYVDYSDGMSYIKYLARLVKYCGRRHLGACLRGKVVRILSKSRIVNTRFLIKGQSLTGTNDERIKEEFIRNIIDSDYSLVVRGGGNFSYRLYEVLSCGRIPLFINTDCVLPFDGLIDWKKYTIWIEESDIQSIAERVVNFHFSLSKEAFHELQLNARRIWEEWLCPAGFYSNIWRCVSSKSAVLNH